ISDSTQSPRIGALSRGHAGDGEAVDSYTSPLFLLEKIAQRGGFCFSASTLYPLLSFQVLRNLVGRRIWWHIWHQLCCQPFTTTCFK
ncbi:hypothetical protein DBR06_SOUSAS6610136, partial [Sousa chinensis]